MILATLQKVWLEVVIILLIILVSAATGYEIGKNSSVPGNQRALVANDTFVTDDASTNASVALIQQVNARSVDTELLAADTVDSLKKTNQVIVYGSVNGAKYYNYGCAAGNRIDEANRVYFESAAAALLAGYEPAVNCQF